MLRLCLRENATLVWPETAEFEEAVNNGESSLVAKMFIMFQLSAVGRACYMS